MDELSFPLRATFLALPLEQNPKWQFQALQEELKPFESVLRFQNPLSPHITMQYWQEVMEIEYNQIMTQAQKIAEGAQPFTIHVEEAETFGSRGEDRVLFLKIGFSDELARLKKSCPWPSGKPFEPHITLARISHPQKFAVNKKEIMKRLKDCLFDIPVDRIRLYAEVEGRKQTPIQDFEFVM
ncbi:MAG: RNA 2',3'-cyclic phosphodiesterase [Patescibacteria group bacterium]